ncbi:MAG: hypothetical protein M0Z49_02990, partial [Chloroflexi bacterium]|nr:hypothetical protein [Chloroflexota bacterium]
MATPAIRRPAVLDIDARRVAVRAAQGVMLIEAAWVLWTLLGNDARFPVGVDFRIYRDAAANWGSCDPSVGAHRPGSDGQSPPRLSIARAIRAFA